MTASLPRRAFTLIELLVVISIIALLIGILLPALGAARDTARSAVCLAHMRGAGQGVAVYTTENDDWLPGPNTSGFPLNDGRDAGEDEGATKPLQNFDWISPTLGNALGLNPDPDQRIQDMFQEEFKCPANTETYGSQAFGDLNPPAGDQLPVSSYSAMTPFLVNPDSSAPGVYVRSWIASVVSQPDNYRSRLDAVGAASLKIWAADGARYVDRNNGAITFNSAAFQIDGGNFANWSPSMSRVVNNGNPYKRDNELEIANSRRFAYRHNDRLNGVFFDGHASTMDVQESQKVVYFFPTGSRVNSTSSLLDQSVQVGDILR